MARCRLRRILGGEAWGGGGENEDVGIIWLNLVNIGNLMHGRSWIKGVGGRILTSLPPVNVIATSGRRHQTVVFFPLRNTISRHVFVFVSGKGLASRQPKSMDAMRTILRAGPA